MNDDEEIVVEQAVIDGVRRRRPRRSRPRSVTIAVKSITRARLFVGRLLYPPVDDIERPRMRADCIDAVRPCPWVACKYHPYLDVNPLTGSIKLNFPDLEPWELKHSCVLDLAEHANTLEQVGEVINVTRERARQLELKALVTLRINNPVLDELGDGGGNANGSSDSTCAQVHEQAVTQEGG